MSTITHPEEELLSVQTHERRLVPDPEAPPIPFETVDDFDREAGIKPITNFTAQARVQTPHSREYAEPELPLTVEQELSALEDEVAKRQERIAELTKEKVFSADKLAHKAIGDLVITKGGDVVLTKLALELKQYLPGNPAVSAAVLAHQSAQPAAPPHNIVHVTPLPAKPVRGKPVNRAKAKAKAATGNEHLSNVDLVSKVMLSFTAPQHIKVIFPALKAADWKKTENNARSTLKQIVDKGWAKNTGKATWVLTPAGREAIEARLGQ